MDGNTQDLENSHETDLDVDSLHQLHRSLDDKVRDLTSKTFLTPDEDLELHRLKKEKLVLKDRIEAVQHQQKSA